MSLGLILLLVGLMYVSTLIPQEIDVTPGKIVAWRQNHQGLLRLVDGVNLHKMYAQPWFAAAILLAAIALGVSSFDQLTMARRRLYAVGICADKDIGVKVAEEKLRAVAKAFRYRSLRTDSPEVFKFVRNPWGYFGGLLLHLGMTLVVAASLYVSLTGRQGVLILEKGEQRSKEQPWNAAEHGQLAAPLQLPGTIRLDNVRLRFDEKNQPAEVASDVSFIDATGRTDSLTATINRMTAYRNLRIYHAAQYGDAFTVAITDENGAEHTEKILIQQPVSLTTAGYSDDFGVAWAPNVFSAKYYVDAERKSMLSRTPLFTIRMLDRGKELARTTLTPGSSGVLGAYRVRLLDVQKWSKLIVVDIKGMPLIFAGFAIIMLGGLLHYLTPPRELIGSRQSDGCYLIYWKAVAFADFFIDERDNLATALSVEGTGWN